jgi:hypothetical protein
MVVNPEKMTDQELARAKLGLEINKLEAEVGNVRRSAFFDPSSWRFTELASFATIVLALLTFGYSTYKDHIQKTRSYTDSVRTAAVQVIANIQGLRGLNQSTALQAEQLVVKTKVALLSDYSPPKHLHALWGSFTELRYVMRIIWTCCVLRLVPEIVLAVP